MEILIAKSSGFCFGVKRAINMAHECADKSDEEIYTLGPIIHNPQVVKELELSQIVPRDGVDEIDKGTVIVRSHGITLQESEEIKNKGLIKIDATCPFVTKAHKIISFLSREGYSVIIVGEREHPEVQGILSYGSGDIMVAASVDEIEGMAVKGKLGIVAQTTQSIKNLQEIVAFCLDKCSELWVYNTICNATSVRQSDSSDLAQHVDCMVVVGGRNSANTNRLAEMCRRIQPKTYHVEVASEVDTSWFDGVERVGITAGASTPDWIINEVVALVKEVGDRGGEPCRCVVVEAENESKG